MYRQKLVWKVQFWPNEARGKAIVHVHYTFVVSRMKMLLKHIIQNDGG